MRQYHPIPVAQLIGRNLSKPAPAILVVPADDQLLRIDPLPPLFEFFLREIESCRRNQMIEHNRMLFTPIEISDGAQVMVIEEMPRDLSPSIAPIERAVDEFRRQIHHCCRNF